MGLLTTGEITKLKIDSYTNPSFSPSSKKGDSFVVMLNPETITRNITLNYQDHKNTSGDRQGVYVGTNPELFSISILLDSSGVVRDASLINIAVTNPFDSSGPQEVSPQVKRLLERCCIVDGEEHRPLFVMITYGDEAGFFKGALQSYNCLLYTSDAADE